MDNIPQIKTRNSSLQIGLVVSSILIFVVALAVFSPRWENWSLEDPYAFERNRAFYLSYQLAYPWIHIPDIGNAVIEWRLLFPVLFFFGGLPSWLYFCLPFVFALLLLYFTQNIIYRETADRKLALAGAIIAPTCSWFFWSTGVLGYMDSFLGLCLLATAFLNRPIYIGAMAFLGSWTDERLIIAIPLIACIQWMLAVRHRDPPNHIVSRWLALGLGVAPFLCLRLYAIMVGHHSQDMSFLAGLTGSGHKFETALAGAWYGLRWAWFLMIPAVLSALRNGPTLPSIFLVPTSIIVAYTLVTIAGDYSRSISTLMPLLVLGLILSREVLARPLCYGLLVFIITLNWLTPAYHVIRHGILRIDPIWSSIPNF